MLYRTQGDAPVPPSYPTINTASALALHTPEAIVPTPSDTNLHLLWRLYYYFLNRKLTEQDLQLSIYHGVEI